MPIPMSSDDDEQTGLIAALQNRSGVILGGVGLVAWIAMVWLMFGDVL
jgi:hypothetical protein